MSLDDLNREIYNTTGEEKFSRVQSQSQYDPFVAQSQSSPFNEQKEWERAKQEISPKQKKVLLLMVIILGVVALSVGGIVFFAWWQKNAFHQDRVSVVFEGPKEADSTQLVKYLIRYKNDNRVTLQNAEILVTYPENFQPMDNVNAKYLNPTTSRIFVGDVKPGREDAVELKGIFYAPKDFPVYLHAVIAFVPSNSTGKLSMETQTSVNITTSPVILEVSAPLQAVDSDKVEYVIDYKNLDLRSLNNVQIRVELPKGLQVTQMQPTASQNETTWVLGNLDSNQGGKIQIKGILRGEDKESKIFSVSLGSLGGDGQLAVYNKREISTSIVSPILTVAQKLDGNTDGVVSAGSTLNYTIAYRNTGETGLRNAVVTAEIQGKILDFSKISAEKGFFDGTKNTITWKASEVPALASINPNSGGEVHFSVPIKAVIPVNNDNDKNFTVTTLAKIDSPDIPTPLDANKIIGSNALEVRLASKVLFDTKGYFKDAKIKNSGPMPLQVGKETLFAVHWAISNISNDLIDGKLTSSLPTGVRWTGMIYPNSEKVVYDSRTNQLTWELGTVASGAGAFLPPREVEFQVGVTPQINQIGNLLTLVNKSIFTATDSFVGKDISLENPAKDTQLSEDETMGYEGGKVKAADNGQ